IYNHRSFQFLLDDEIKKTETKDARVSLMLLDIDYFKFYNDAFGHQVGDQVLKKVAEILLEASETKGFCARYGGEEFAIILPELPLEKVKELGEEVRKRIEQTDLPGIEVLPNGRLTISVGIAQYPTNAKNKEILIQKADEALYKAKFMSKNRVEIYYSVFDELSSTLKEEEKELLSSIRALTMVINAKDRYTYGHSLRTMEMAKELAIKLELDVDEAKNICYGALLHDVGKIEVSRDILNNSSKLTKREWEILKQHPLWGADMVRPMETLSGAKEIILYHHENYDGSGYPFGQRGLSIPIGARILRIVDSYDAITTNRPYKESMLQQEALVELLKYSGTHYDPQILNEFCCMMQKRQLAQTSSL
ncbi:MAG: diguanylate cyclase, partial [Bacillota bacterium]|nr:diguanylate cyclase [Bacillota bacterium]